jgi:hypothetical protein
VRRGNIPQVMVALRNTTIGVLRWAGYRKIAKAGRSVSTARREVFNGLPG